MRSALAAAPQAILDALQHATAHQLGCSLHARRGQQTGSSAGPACREARAAVIDTGAQGRCDQCANPAPRVVPGRTAVLTAHWHAVGGERAAAAALLQAPDVKGRKLACGVQLAG